MMKKLVIFSGAGISQESGLQGKDRILECRPNEAHLITARLEEKYEVTVITQNGDDFHQRAVSTRVILLHGEALKNASTLRPYIQLDIDRARLL